MNPTICLRDIVKMDGYSTNILSVITILEIGGRDGGMPGHVGWPHMTQDYQEETERDILYKLSRKGFEGDQRFMLNGNDFRIYTDNGNSHDFCYGVSYDPRVWNGLEGGGFIVKRMMPHETWQNTDYDITPSGQDKLVILTAKIFGALPSTR